MNAEIESAHAVLIGSFNPAIFQPAWLAANGLVRKEEAEKASIAAITNDIASFSADWLRVQVTPDKFAASTLSPAYYCPLRDLVVGVFSVLEHTPIRMMGINARFHYRVESEERWHAFGHRVAPKAGWQDLIQSPGMRAITIEGKRPDSDAKFIRATAEPSQRIKPAGIYFAIHEHYELTIEETQNAQANLIKTLKDSWEGSLAYARRICEHMLAQG